MTRLPNCVRSHTCADDEVFVETGGPIEIAKVYQTDGRTVIKCDQCDNSAVVVDRYHPYYTEGNRCRDHKENK